MFAFSLYFSFILTICAAQDLDFIINNEKCRMPNFPAFSNETNVLFKSLPYLNCTDLNLLTYTTVVNNTAYLHIDGDTLNQYYSPSDETDCCYSYVYRKGTGKFPDNGIRYSSCVRFNTTTILKEPTVSVKCYLGADKIYENVHTTITVPESIRERLNNFANRLPPKKKPLSVLFLVIDSVARLNFERTMPLTRNFSLHNDFIEFVGYSKIDDNTFPNFNALLTGLNLKQSESICKPRMVGGLDKCPMVWYKFRDAGYVTAYAEDWADLSTYNYHKKGFKSPPTDYYYKPYMEASKRVNIVYVDNMPFCAGPESHGERTLNIAKDFATTYKNQPYFGIFWMNTFSHNKVNSPSRMDEVFANFMEDIKAAGVLEDSMVVLLADHGIRFGEIRRTIQGWYEERLPMNYVSMPKWFQEEYPAKYENLRENARKLTSTYDLYLTLEEVLEMGAENYTTTGSRACANCSSLFSEINEVRSCSEAGIPEKWCTCIGKFQTTHVDLTPSLKKNAVDFIMRANVLSLPTTSINKILSTSISRLPKKMYIKIIFEADDSIIYLVVLRTTVDPVRFVKIVHVVQLGKVPPFYIYK